jgi:acetyltransferase-like isoleucine patch superfamily enzyme
MNAPVSTNAKVALKSDSKDVPNFYFTKRFFNHPDITVGDYTYGQPRIRWLMAGRKVVIGKFCSLAPEVEIFVGGNHRPDYVTTYPFAALPSDWPGAKGETPTSKGDVVIGNDVWIGTGARILSGVTIGDGAVIGAFAVVSKDVSPYAVAVGNPAREVKKRFDDATIKKLLKLEWWNWDEAKIRRNLEVLSSPDVEKLFECK